MIGKLPIIGQVIDSVADVVDDLYTSPEELAKLELQRYAIDASLMKGQIEVNKVEAAHKSVWVAGWRPGIGWVCAYGLFYNFAVYPLLMWLWYTAQILFDFDHEPPPMMSIEYLIGLVTTMLGSSWLRNQDKKNGTETRQLSAPSSLNPFKRAK